LHYGTLSRILQVRAFTLCWGTTVFYWHYSFLVQAFCNLIGDLKSEIGPTPCDKKCCSEHQTLFARVEGLVTRLSWAWRPGYDYFYICSANLIRGVVKG